MEFGQVCGAMGADSSGWGWGSEVGAVPVAWWTQLGPPTESQSQADAPHPTRPSKNLYLMVVLVIS